MQTGDRTRETQDRHKEGYTHHVCWFRPMRGYANSVKAHGGMMRNGRRSKATAVTKCAKVQYTPPARSRRNSARSCEHKASVG